MQNAEKEGISAHHLIDFEVCFLYTSLELYTTPLFDVTYTTPYTTPLFDF